MPPLKERKVRTCWCEPVCQAVRCVLHCCFTSTETIRLIRDGGKMYIILMCITIQQLCIILVFHFTNR